MPEWGDREKTRSLSKEGVQKIYYGDLLAFIGTKKSTLTANMIAKCQKLIENRPYGANPELSSK